MSKSKKEIQQFKRVVDKFAQENGHETPRCISDQTLLYIRYIFHVLRSQPRYWYDQSVGHNVLIDDSDGEDYLKEAENKSLEIMKQLRGSEYISNSSPRTVSASIVYVACVITGTNVTQREVAVAIDTNDSSIKKHYNIIKKELKL